VNSLQIGLIAIGAVVVALLFLWHWWQSRRVDRPAKIARSIPPVITRPSTPVAPAPASIPAPISEPAYERIEPTLDGRAAGDWEPQAAEKKTEVFADEITYNEIPPALRAHDTFHDVAATEPAVPTYSPPPERAPASPAAPPKLRSEWPFDERLHVHASFVNLTGGAFDAAPFLAVAGRAVGWVRLFRQSPWEQYDAANVGSVQQLVLALPLASRQGPIEAQDMDAWQFALSELSTTQGCEAHFYGFRDAPHRAAELDNFLAAVDIMPDVYLVKKDGGHWTGTRLRGTLEANGFRLQSDGRFAYHEIESDAVIFHAVDGFERPFTPERLRADAITALRFSIEPVRLTHPLVRYDSFRQSLRGLSKLLDAELKSSEGELLDDAKFATMREEVKTAMDAIVGAGIEPGSDTARSLFG
jgi:ZipA, C-terminal FtsZ-binding domain